MTNKEVFEARIMIIKELTNPKDKSFLCLEILSLYRLKELKELVAMSKYDAKYSKNLFGKETNDCRNEIP